MTELEKYIQSYFGVSREELEGISSLFRPLDMKRGDYFLRTGGLSNRLGFVQHGFIREFVQLGEREVTKWISMPGYFVVDLASFLFREPARWTIQALTDCELHVIDQADYQGIRERIPRWPELEKMFIARCFAVLEQRILQHLSLSAEERYRQLFQHNPELFNQVPLQYLASMLGMTPETFSRLRRKSGRGLVG
ncbi:MAG TPA: Crp/Fnr family transcriptional regulator [Chitinophagaceae bacterium]|nr:Crp/Fnr family transcriptional regulator [Chitinophagaceae bacterium]